MTDAQQKPFAHLSNPKTSILARLRSRLNAIPDKSLQRAGLAGVASAAIAVVILGIVVGTLGSATFAAFMLNAVPISMTAGFILTVASSSVLVHRENNPRPESPPEMINNASQAVPRRSQRLTSMTLQIIRR